MMKNSILFFSLFAGMFLFPPNGVASYKSTHTSTPKPEPAFQFEQLDKAYKTAAVCFLGVGDCDNEISYGKGGDGEDYTIDTAAQCKNEGFILNNCNSVQVPEGYCPYNKSYITRCKCASNLVTCLAGQVGVGENCGGKYASCKCDPALKTCSSKEVGQGASCGGKYQSCACKSEYAYNTSNCTSPRSVSGASCGGKYTGCSCPKGVSVGAYGCEEYYGSPCSSVCKKAYSDNCRNRTAVSTPYGCAEYWDDCSSKCKTKYNDNCRNRTAVISSCPANAACSYFSDCSSKVQSWECKAGYTKSGNSCIENCSLRTAVTCPQGCQTYYSDCPTKCQSCRIITCNTAKSTVDNILTLGTSVTVGGQSIYNYASPKGIACRVHYRMSTALDSMRKLGWSCSNCTAQAEDGKQTAGYNCTCIAQSVYPNGSMMEGGNGGIDTMCNGWRMVCPSSKCKAGYMYSGGGCVACSGNTYSTRGSESCTPCPSGTEVNSSHTACEQYNYNEKCPGYTAFVCAGDSCKDSCTACGITRYKLTLIPNPSPSCNGTWTTCGGKKCCCSAGESCNGPRLCKCLAVNEPEISGSLCRSPNHELVCNGQRYCCPSNVTSCSSAGGVGGVHGNLTPITACWTTAMEAPAR